MLSVRCTLNSFPTCCSHSEPTIRTLPMYRKVSQTQEMLKVRLRDINFVHPTPLLVTVLSCGILILWLYCETSLKPLFYGQCFAILQDVRTRLNPVCVHMDNFTAAKQSISDKTVFKDLCTDERVVVW